MTKLTTLAQIKAALAEEGALLMQRDSAYNQDFYVQRANGTRIWCSKVADRLTWMQAGKPAAVTFSHREPLAIYYAPTR